LFVIIRSPSCKLYFALCLA